MKGYDYSNQGWYFVTVCTQRRWLVFGEIRNEKVMLSEAGRMADKFVLEFGRFGNVKIDDYAIMPNHVHMILNVGADPRVRPKGSGSTQGSTPTLGNYIKRFKTLTTRIYIKNVRENGWEPFEKRLWQRNYYEHIIRNEKELNAIREYIKLNPVMWDRDRNNPKNFS